MLFAFATMVDSRKGGVMADRIDHLTERVQVVEAKVDRLSSTVNELATAMVAGFVEQREYTEFSHARLAAKMDAGFARVDRKLDQVIDAQRPRPKPKRRNE